MITMKVTPQARTCRGQLSNYIAGHRKHVYRSGPHRPLDHPDTLDSTHLLHCKTVRLTSFEIFQGRQPLLCTRGATMTNILDDKSHGSQQQTCKHNFILIPC